MSSMISRFSAVSVAKELARYFLIFTKNMLSVSNMFLIIFKIERWIKLRAECQFAKAGQGLFYNGIIVNKNGRKPDIFSFVYDCGTSGASEVLNDSVDAYRNIVKNKLDLLFISHLHQDHISHIPRLIDRVGVDIVFLPDIIPEIRLFLASGFGEVELNSELIYLYSDPVGYFIAHGARCVVLMMGEGESSTEGRENRTEDNKETYNGITIQTLGGKLEKESKGNVKIIKCSGMAQVVIPTVSWEFRIINMNFESYKKFDFIKQIQEILEKNNNDFFSILTNKKELQQLRGIYKKCFGDINKNINETSVIVHSYPIGGGDVVDKGRVYRNGKADTLLLGDISINEVSLGNMHRDLLKDHCCPCVIQLPHHGARIDFCPCCCEWNKCHCAVLVASYGLTNNYGHPDFSFDHCFDCDDRIRLVNERQDYSYTVFSEKKSTGSEIDR